MTARNASADHLLRCTCTESICASGAGRGRHVEKIKYFFIVLCIVLVSITAAGCATTGNRADAQPAVIEHFAEIKAVEGQLDYYIGRIDAASEQLEHIRSRQAEQGQVIDAIIQEFEEYQYTVELLLRYYQQLRDAIKDPEGRKSNSENLLGYYKHNFDSACSNFCVQADIP